MMIKYRVHEVAKDFDVPSKTVMQILKEHFDSEKKAQTALEEDELNVVFDAITRSKAVDSFDDYFAAGEKAREERKKQAEKEKADREAEQARIAEDGGVTVVVDRCLKIEHARYVGRMHWLGFNTQRITSVRTGLQ